MQYLLLYLFSSMGVYVRFHKNFWIVFLVLCTKTFYCDRDFSASVYCFKQCRYFNNIDIQDPNASLVDTIGLRILLSI